MLVRAAGGLLLLLHVAAGQAPDEHAPIPWLRREPVHPLKCVPQLLCIGTQKGGTTSWHDWLLAGYHPALHVPRRTKEIHYFDWQAMWGGESAGRAGQRAARMIFLYGVQGAWQVDGGGCMSREYVRMLAYVCGC